MSVRAKFDWAERVPRRDIQRLYESDAQGLLDEELLERVHYAIYNRVRDMFELREAQLYARVTCRQCGERIKEPFLRGSRNKNKMLACGNCGWAVTCGEFYNSYSGKSMLPASATAIFTEYMERFPRANSARDKLLLIDWLIHKFHVHQGVAGKPVGKNVICGSTDQVRELIESLAGSPYSTQGLSSLDEWQAIYYDKLRLFKQKHTLSQVQKIAAELGIPGRRSMSQDELIGIILRLAPHLES